MQNRKIPSDEMSGFYAYLKIAKCVHPFMGMALKYVLLFQHFWTFLITGKYPVNACHKLHRFDDLAIDTN